MKTQKEYPETHFRSSEAERIHNEGYELMLINNTLPFNNRPVLGDAKHGFVSMSWDAWHKNRDSMRLKRLTNPQLLNGEIKNDRIVSLYKGCKVHRLQINTLKDMKKQILEIAEKLRLELITEDEAQDLLLGLFGVSGRFYTDKEIEKIKYLSFLQGTVDGDTGEE